MCEMLEHAKAQAALFNIDYEERTSV